ncbi:chemotaxis response regulator protein-glutamate methylesterase [bacterium]|nr:chemotaxis response regulator protein-glutamate methylesterase [bacterium]MCB2201559.1 chemotaxis response regulator protein-glutamate methylesterase [bacterium]
MTSPSPSTPIRIVVVDDSAFMRKAISMMLESDPAFKVVGTARDGEEGVEKVRLLKPDLVTMDIEMPRMDGLAALREIMIKCPTPVMMISSITTEGAEATLEALELGAVDFIPKQSSYVSLDIVKIRDDLLTKIKDIVRRKHVLMSMYRQRQFSRFSSAPTVAAPPTPRKDYSHTAVDRPKVVGKRLHRVEIIAIGSSTGGPPALQKVVPALPANLPVGVVIAQHMPPMFTKSLADRLNGLSKVSVREAVDGETLGPGTVLIAPGGQHLTVKKFGTKAIVKVSEHPKETLYHPCVDVLFNSVANEFGKASMGVMLTGMGNNGVHGSQNMKEKGGILIAQNEDTCVVYGMPRAVIEANIVDHIASIDRISDEMLSYF